MEERYEIRGKIGQGGLGSVYKGYDTRMRREVAIKRISMSNEDPALQEESTRQLIKEAGALASLQHPHIVTVYDVGTDEDGPYVVMELIAGKTLDELIERAPLTWNDFRELALQTQEALIAAQELDLIHSDIKPSNLMLTWLPSGKFQVKIVDFGLATLTQSQSLEELEEIEAVFGSIFFMAPEQFERVPIDARTDMYAMGCVYYQALTGSYPFKGETGNEVMVSHLHHKVVPIQHVRADIPLWACDWIMWHLNRMPADRPESARQSLQVFLQNDKIPNPTMSLGKAAAAKPAGPRPRLVVPGGTAAGPGRQVRPAPTARVHPSVAAAMAASNTGGTEEEIPNPPETTTAPQPLMPPEGFKPSVHTGPVGIPDAIPSEEIAVQPSGPVTIPGTRLVVNPQAKKQPKKANGKKIIMAIVMILIILILGYFLSIRIRASKASHHFNDILEMASSSGTSEIEMTTADVNQLLSSVGNAKNDVEKGQALKALELAKPTDGGDFNAIMTDFAVHSNELLPEDRESLIRDVLAKRANPKMVTDLTNYAREANTPPQMAVVAIDAMRSAATDEHFDDYLSVVQFSTDPQLSKAAEDTAADILKRSSNRGALMDKVDSALKSANSGRAKDALNRLKK